MRKLVEAAGLSSTRVHQFTRNADMQVTDSGTPWQALPLTPHQSRRPGASKP
ncbi:hypothetical protein [Streptomyces sp. NPDC002088]|uniref:hypothetical protein n=1 Tax=Streptomyces sp. NPDC002088 TaxID=3154665 RepID=UPI0033225723